MQVSGSEWLSWDEEYSSFDPEMEEHSWPRHSGTVSERAIQQPCVYLKTLAHLKLLLSLTKVGMSLLFRRLGNSVSVVTRAYSQGRASAQPPPNPPRTVGEDNIYNKLESKFSPSQLLVQDVSGIFCRTAVAVHE
jgi:hypothetical protein